MGVNIQYRNMRTISIIINKLSGHVPRLIGKSNVIKTHLRAVLVNNLLVSIPLL